MSELYKDSTASTPERVEDLLSRMTIEEKVGQLFQQMIAPGPGGTVSEGDPVFGLPPTRGLIEDKQISHFNVLGAPDTTREFAQWINSLQEIAENTRLGIPVSISSDPRHAFTDNPAAALMTRTFSQWPETLGLAAIGDEDITEEFGDIARREYIAVGIRTALHPQIDLATEARWARGNGTFGEDATLTARMGCAYVRGFQGTGKFGEGFGTTSVSAMAKHFPGGGPQMDGEDPHFEYGREQVYPGGMFDLHLEPFKAIIAEGTRQMMPYYGMPVGTEWEEVGFCFNKGILTDLLRNKMGFEGIICTDWGLVTDAEIMGQPFPARAWGVEHLSEEDRALKIIEAGADQFGGETCTEIILALVESGRVTQARIDESVRRLLTEKFELGLFDDKRYVDLDEAERIVGSEEFRAKGLAAQRASITVLKNSECAAHLPLAGDQQVKLFVEGGNAEAYAAYATIVDSAEDADVVLVRAKTPFEERGPGFEAFFHAGSLEFTDEEREHILALCAAKPVIMDIYLERPAIITPFAEGTEEAPGATAIVANYGASDEALADVLFGASAPKGRLPFDLPRSMAAVVEANSDTPFDTKDPVYRFGHGLSL